MTGEKKRVIQLLFFCFFFLFFVDTYLLSVDISSKQNKTKQAKKKINKRQINNHLAVNRLRMTFLRDCFQLRFRIETKKGYSIVLLPLFDLYFGICIVCAYGYWYFIGRKTQLCSLSIQFNGMEITVMKTKTKTFTAHNSNK